MSIHRDQTEEEQNSNDFYGDFEFLLSNETKFGIITAVRLYRHLKLKQIAAILGKSETTLITHVHDLLDKDFLIQLDRKKIGKSDQRGKYYGLSEKSVNITHKLFSEIWERDFSQDINLMKTKSEAEFKNYIINQLKQTSVMVPLNLTKAGSLLNKNIANITAQMIQNAINDVQHNKTPNLPLGTTNIYLNSIPVANHTHVVQITELFIDFLQKLTRLEREIRDSIKDEEQKEINSFQYVHLFTAPLSSDLQASKGFF